METIKKISARKLVLKHLEDIRRPLTWLAEVTDIPYGSIYSIFIQQTMELTQERLDKINKGLETDFKL